MSELPSALSGLLLVLCAGRLALSLLPPGWPGAHRPRELGATAAASWLLGLSLLALQAALLAALGARPPAALLLAPWAALLALRLATLPGAMRPRHEPRAERPSTASRLLLAIGLLGLARPLTLAPPEPATLEGPLALLSESLPLGGAPLLGVLAFAGLAIFVERGLERGRRAPIQRALAFAAVAWLPPLQAEAARGAATLFVALSACAAGAGAIAWLRRADRRALALAWLGLGAAALLAPAGWIAAAGGLALLAVATPRPSRARAASGGAATLALALLARAADGAPFALPGPELALALVPVALLAFAQAALRGERAEALA